jgi:hypothetical protein
MTITRILLAINIAAVVINTALAAKHAVQGTNWIFNAAIALLAASAAIVLTRTHH